MNDEGRPKDDGKGNGTRFRYLAMLALVLLGVTLTAGTAAADRYEDGIRDIWITDRVDKDGDGYLSEFDVGIEADTEIRENGKEYTGGVFQNKGHPKLVIAGSVEGYSGSTFADFELGGGKGISMMIDQPGVGPSQFRYEIDLEKMRAKEFGKRFKGEGPDERPYNVLYDGDKITKIWVHYLESDSVSYNYDLTQDVIVDSGDGLPLREPIRLEPSSLDKTGKVEVTSNVRGAAVYVEGDEVGETPWTGQLPVDNADREGKTTIRIEKDGYTTASKNLKVSPPTMVDLEMGKVKKPLVVKSNQEGGTVKFDGTTVGTAPISKKVWTERSVDVTVEKSGYETWTREGTTAPATISADLTSTDSDTDGNDSYVYVPTFTFADVLANISLSALENASFTASPAAVETGQNVSLDGSPSFVLSGTDVTYRWDFGDGATGTGVNATHSYSDDGTYEVTLTLEGTNGTLDTAKTKVKVENRGPDPRLSLAGSPVTGRSVMLAANGSTDPDGSVAEYRWDFDGDGSIDATTTDPRTSHVYENPGTYAPMLETVDDDGATESTSLPSVEVEEPNEGPRAEIDAPREAAGGEDITLDASPSADPDGSIAEYHWDLGDGATATGATVTHSFDRGGTYDVTLTVVDDDGAMGSERKKVTVKGEGGTPTPEPTEAAPETTGSGGGSPIAEILEAILDLFGV